MKSFGNHLPSTMKSDARFEGKIISTEEKRKKKREIDVWSPVSKLESRIPIEKKNYGTFSFTSLQLLMLDGGKNWLLGMKMISMFNKTTSTFTFPTFILCWMMGTDGHKTAMSHAM